MDLLFNNLYITNDKTKAIADEIKISAHGSNEHSKTIAVSTILTALKIKKLITTLHIAKNEASCVFFVLKKQNVFKNIYPGTKY
jgi:hypothetical protein